MTTMQTAARLALVSAANKTKITSVVGKTRQYATKTESGAFLAEPQKVPLGLGSVTGTVATGLLLGAAISKNMASFLEENELFVPSDDDLSFRFEHKPFVIYPKNRYNIPARNNSPLGDYSDIYGLKQSFKTIIPIDFPML